MLENSYTAAEVATNNGKNGSRIWIIIKGGVYDVTDFINNHPGGGELITEFAGKDATKAFNQAGHSSDASKDLKKYRIGVIGDSRQMQTVPVSKSATEQSYTPAEVAKNNGTNGSRVWITIKEVVYDVTDFIDKHPGGGELIAEYAGKDATKAFNQAGHSSDASRDLKKYRIGTVTKKSSQVQVESTFNLKDSASQATLYSTKSEKRRRIKFLFCV